MPRNYLGVITKIMCSQKRKCILGSWIELLKGMKAGFTEAPTEELKGGIFFAVV